MAISDTKPIPLAGREISASGGPYRQFAVRLDDGTQHYITFQKVEMNGFEPRPHRPTNDNINEIICILANSRAFG